MTIAQRALAAFPGGISNGEFGLPPEALLAIRRGEGARLWDTDGKEYLDFSLGWGSALVGHACPEVVAAVTAQAPLGSNFAYLVASSTASGTITSATTPSGVRSDAQSQKVDRKPCTMIARCPILGRTDAMGHVAPMTSPVRAAVRIVNSSEQRRPHLIETTKLN